MRMARRNVAMANKKMNERGRKRERQREVCMRIEEGTGRGGLFANYQVLNILTHISLTLPRVTSIWMSIYISGLLSVARFCCTWPQITRETWVCVRMRVCVNVCVCVGVCNRNSVADANKSMRLISQVLIDLRKYNINTQTICTLSILNAWISISGQPWWALIKSCLKTVWQPIRSSFQASCEFQIVS